MKCIYLFIVTLSYLNSYANENLNLIEYDKIKLLLESYNDPRINKSIEKSFFEDIITSTKDTLFYNPQGTLHLFRIVNDSSISVEKISKSLYHGHNFNRHLIYYNRNIYSCGGEGLFNTFPGIIKFDFKNQEWYKLKINSYPKNTNKVYASWLYNDTLKVLLTDNNLDDKGQLNFIFGKIDLKNLDFFHIGEFKTQTSTELSSMSSNIVGESKRYSIIQKSGTKRCYFQLFDKKNGEFLDLKLLNTISCLEGNSILYIKDSTFFHLNETGELDSTIINESNIFKKRELENWYLNLIRYERKNYVDYKLFIVLIALSLATFIFLFFKKHKIKNNTYKVIEKKLLCLKGEIISKDKLDEIFQISDFGVDTIKSKRSLIINEINKGPRIKITRLRKSDDKRFFEYFIK